MFLVTQLVLWFYTVLSPDICSANDICKESNRQILNAEDVFKALEEIEFVEFIEPLRDFLEG